MNSDLANGDRDRSAPQPTAEEIKPPPVDPKTKDFKKRVESWLKDSADDVTKADEYLEKKKEIKATRGSNTDLKSGEYFVSSCFMNSNILFCRENIGHIA